ncbi:MAG: hypothetical protein KDD47_22060, partial [Acidobacteria bacterium]|nr:hypothetical protein [Acidobacteriota bacterium]
MRRKTRPWAKALLPLVICASRAASGMATAQDGPSAPPDEPVTSTEELLGIWAGAKTFGPEVSGPLAVETEGKRWWAEIAGYAFSARFRDGELSFEVPGERGSFRGAVDEATGSLLGQWIQPGMRSAFGQRFSTPVSLSKTAPGRWQGEVSPLPDTIHVYLVLERDAAGALHAFLRNPESNFGRILNLTEVRRSGSEVELLGTFAWARDEAPQPLLSGTYRKESDEGEVLSIFIDGLGGTFDLRRLEDGEDSPFYPRSWADGAYAYRPPTPLQDGW